MYHITGPYCERYLSFNRRMFNSVADICSHYDFQEFLWIFASLSIDLIRSMSVLFILSDIHLGDFYVGSFMFDVSSKNFVSSLLQFTRVRYQYRIFLLSFFFLAPLYGYIFLDAVISSFDFIGCLFWKVVNETWWSICCRLMTEHRSVEIWVYQFADAVTLSTFDSSARCFRRFIDSVHVTFVCPSEFQSSYLVVCGELFSMVRLLTWQNWP